MRVIWIQQADKLKKSVQENLLPILQPPAPGQTLYFSSSAWQKNTTFYKTAEKEGVILDFVN